MVGGLGERIGGRMVVVGFGERLGDGGGGGGGEAGERVGKDGGMESGSPLEKLRIGNESHCWEQSDAALHCSLIEFRV